MMPQFKFIAISVLCVLSLSAAVAHADAISLTLKDHRFTPDRVIVPHGRDITLRVKNADSTPAEFESHSLRREKIIPGGKEVVIALPALKAGEYLFFDEFHEKTATGVLIVQE